MASTTTPGTGTNPTPNPKGYADDEWFYSANGLARACFTDIGEGYEGDYDASDPDDAPLYRLDVNVAAAYAEQTWAEETDDPAWVYPSDGSICTHVEIDAHDPAVLIDLLTYAADAVAEALTSGTTSVKKAMDALSYLPTKR